MLNERASAFYRPHQGLNRLLPFDPWKQPAAFELRASFAALDDIGPGLSEAPQQDAVRAAAARFSASTLDAAASQTLQDFRRVLAETSSSTRRLSNFNPSYVSAAATLGSASSRLSDLRRALVTCRLFKPSWMVWVRRRPIDPRPLACDQRSIAGRDFFNL